MHASCACANIYRYVYGCVWVKVDVDPKETTYTDTHAAM